MNDEEIQELIHYKPRWTIEDEAKRAGAPIDEAIPFTDDEKATLAALPNRNCASRQ